MGLYDEIRCAYPLPGDPPAFAREPGHRFQTKSLDCDLSLYDITADGFLIRASGPWGNDSTTMSVPFDGGLEFYTSNLLGCGPGGYRFTRAGEDAVSVTYAARFRAGRLRAIRCAERTTYKALPVVAQDRRWCVPTDAEQAEMDRLYNERLAGRTMFLLYGGSEIQEGQAVTVVADGAKAWAVQTPDGGLRLVQRGLRGHVLFDSRQDAAAAREAERVEQERELARLAALMAARGT